MLTRSPPVLVPVARTLKWTRTSCPEVATPGVVATGETSELATVGSSSNCAGVRCGSRNAATLTSGTTSRGTKWVASTVATAPHGPTTVDRGVRSTNTSGSARSPAARARALMSHTTSRAPAVQFWAPVAPPMTFHMTGPSTLLVGIRIDSPLGEAEERPMENATTARWPDRTWRLTQLTQVVLTSKVPWATRCGESTAPTKPSAIQVNGIWTPTSVAAGIRRNQTGVGTVVTLVYGERTHSQESGIEWHGPLHPFIPHVTFPVTFALGMSTRTRPAPAPEPEPAMV
mmetsp:Transcript_14557/g.25911  ORF Transcript_14557/g.25911 Transcript_14557/m.25911 type:complete len:287 (+) Transcript_14557:1496-2356(+)